MRIFTVSQLYVVFIPVVIFLAHALFFTGWVADDAGISYAYARNLVQGYGLVAQPGLEPVEGFSNFLWVMILAAFFALGVFHPIIVPKILGIALVIGAYVAVYRTWAKLPGIGPLSVLIALGLTSLNTAFVVWTMSGMENALYVFLLCLLMFFVIESCYTSVHRTTYALIAGILVTLISLTRPDGAVYLMVYPVSLLVVKMYRRDPVTKTSLSVLAIYLLAFSATFGIFLLFRLFYFGELLPNTYYAKDGPDAATILSVIALKAVMVTKFLTLMRSVVGDWGALFSLGLVIATTLGIRAQIVTWEMSALLVALVCSILVYLLLPEDWMAEYRFGTPFVIWFNLYSVFLVSQFVRRWRWSAGRRALATALVCLVIGATVIHMFPRSLAFSAHPVLDFRWVVDRYGKRFNAYADVLGLDEASVLLPDLGGTLFVSRLRIYDLAGLCDRIIARTLRRSNNNFRDYIFEEIRPTFIHTHGYWTLVARFSADDRFKRDYVAIHEKADDWIRKRIRQNINSGDYVRRDALRDNPDALARLRALK